MTFESSPATMEEALLALAVGEQLLKVNEVIEYFPNVPQSRAESGIIQEFRKRELGYWMRVKNITSQEDEWISVTNWQKDLDEGNIRN